jgi:hypothetical protein
LLGSATYEELENLKGQEQLYQAAVDAIFENMGFINYIFGAKLNDERGIGIHRASCEDGAVLLASLEKARQLQYAKMGPSAGRSTRMN